MSFPECRSDNTKVLYGDTFTSRGCAVLGQVKRRERPEIGSEET
jgi:hypothetical protein